MPACTDQWLALTSGNGFTDSIQLTGDFDGDGKADKTVFRPSTGQWFVYGPRDTTSPHVVANAYGAGGADIPTLSPYVYRALKQSTGGGITSGGGISSGGGGGGPFDAFTLAALLSYLMGGLWRARRSRSLASTLTSAPSARR